MCLKGMNQMELESLCIEAGETNFRGLQLFEWMYRHGISSFDSMLNVNKSFREHLKEHYILQTLKLEKSMPSKEDNTVKILFKTQDDCFIETVSMVDRDRHTVCISSQAGCALDCSFCATGAVGFKRNLTSDEIVDQVLFFRSIGQEVDSVSLMGMGESLQNPNIFDALELFTSKTYMNMSQRRLNLSTIGVIPGIEELNRNFPQINLTFSLHSPFR